MAAVVKKSGNKNAYVDMSKFVPRCKKPRYDSNEYGHPIVVMWDCEKGKDVIYGQEEYVRKRDAGEL